MRPPLPRLSCWSVTFNDLGALASLVAGLAAGYPDVHIEVLDTSVSEALQTARDLEQRGKADVFVCAGATAAYLRRHLARPVLTMRVGGGDLLRALEQAREHSSHVALLSYNRIDRDLQAMRTLFTVQVHQVAYTTLEEARQAVLEVARPLPQHHRFVDGGGAGGTGRPARRAVAERRHCAQGAREAMGVLDSQRLEIAKRRHLDAVLQHIPSGVAAVDNQGVVQSLNPALAQLLELPVSSALGRPLQQLCPELDPQQALEDGGGEENRVIRLGSHAVVSNLLPILENGERTGLVLTCQDITAVQRADQRIRSTRRPGAFTARYRLEQLNGASKANREMLQLAKRFAASHSTILITGESGTGKELLAQGSITRALAGTGLSSPSTARRFPSRYWKANCSATRKAPSAVRAKAASPACSRRRTVARCSRRDRRHACVAADSPPSCIAGARGLAPGRHRADLHRRAHRRRHPQGPGAAMKDREFRTDLYYRLNILRLQTTPCASGPRTFL